MICWQFRPLNPNDNSGISTVEDNFANEERTSVEILVRETLQNPLDARLSGEHVRVRYNLVSVDRNSSAFMPRLFDTNCLNHFAAGGLISELPSSVDFLVIEDFGTCGLEGTFEDSSVDGPGENWNAFWFREGEGAKPSKANGGAGQGKITLYAASAIRSVLALTRRKSDNVELLFGCCRFRRNYKLAGDSKRWAKEARWCSTKNPEALALPITDSQIIDALKAELQLARGEKTGTTFIVPMPHGIALDDVRRAVLNEFFFPIRRGRLTVEVGNVKIDEHSVARLAGQLGINSRYSTEYRKFLEAAITEHIAVPATTTLKPGWGAAGKLSDSNFEEGGGLALSQQFGQGGLVSADFPVRIRKKGEAPETGVFRVVVQQYSESEHSQELFVRQDLGIDGEKRLRGSRRVVPVLALTFIDDLNLSAFLVAAEEPTHRTWNASRPRLTLLYDGAASLMSNVRNAALRLVEFLTPEGVRDQTALAPYFAVPEAQDSTARGGGGNKPTQRGGETQSLQIPPPKPKPVEVKSEKDGFTVRALNNETKSSFPLHCTVQTAYATTWGNPFSQWDAAEFWLNSEQDFPITADEVSNLVRDGNELRFDLLGPSSYLQVHGFDPHRRLEVQLQYRGLSDAENIEDY
ncbi:hypothetical protein NX773_19500 [Massilia solisilvae]|uniref:Uncharacterized protein n=1 Tax=Massilia solisilvae TaxID=1811225 RepID=A0ABT2BPD8_9BURK|nr:hypothetical protein [Massilia solisilvae]MCS0610357.1 hypothetical protein [Massilia solisilvae]